MRVTLKAVLIYVHLPNVPNDCFDKNNMIENGLYLSNLLPVSLTKQTYK